MSIIHCPECNEKISSTVSQCVHCGVKIAVCPECEKIYTDHPDRCSECGYVFKEKHIEMKNQEKKEEKFTASELKAKWKFENPIHYVIEYADLVLFLIALTFMAISTSKFSSWANSAGLDALLNVNDIFDTTKTLWIFVAIFGILSSICKEIESSLTSTMLSTWAGIKKISFVEVIKNTFLVDYSKTVEEEKEKADKDLRFVVDTAFFSSDYLSKNKRIISHVIVAMLNTAYTILFCVFLIHNLEIFLKAEILKSDILGIKGWSFSMIENWWQPVAGVVLIIAEYIYKKIQKNQMDKKRVEWFEKNLPDYEENKEYAISID